MGKFAISTSVSTDASRAEIERTLNRYGADGFRYAWAERDGKRIEQIDFTINERIIRFTLPMPSRDEREFTHTAGRGTERSQTAALKSWEQSCRQRWRALSLSVKSKLECVECGITEFDEEFMAHIVDPKSDKTMGQIVIPQIDKVYKGLPGKIGLPGLPAPNGSET